MFNKTNKFKYCSLFVVAFSVAASFDSVADASSVRASHRTLNTKSAIPVAPGRTEVEYGLDYSRPIGRALFDNGWGKKDRLKARLWDWRVTATHGLNHGMDAFISAGWFDVKDRQMPGMIGTDKHGRGLSDVSVGITKQLDVQDERITLSYIPELFIPVGRETQSNGRIGLGRDFWELNQTLAMTMKRECSVINANVSHSIPFGRTRRYYSKTFMVPRENVRGITAATAEAMYTATAIKPMANLSYAHEWISGDNDSDFVTAGIGAKMQMTGDSQLLVGYDYPVAGRNSMRTQSWKVLVTQEF